MLYSEKVTIIRRNQVAMLLVARGRIAAALCKYMG